MQFLLGPPAAVHKFLEVAGVIAHVQRGAVGGNHAERNGTRSREQAPGFLGPELLDPEIDRGFRIAVEGDVLLEPPAEKAADMPNGGIIAARGGYFHDLARSEYTVFTA